MLQEKHIYSKYIQYMYVKQNKHSMRLQFSLASVKLRTGGSLEGRDCLLGHLAWQQSHGQIGLDKEKRKKKEVC